MYKVILFVGIVAAHSTTVIAQKYSSTLAKNSITLKWAGVERLRGGQVLLGGKLPADKFSIKSKNINGVTIFSLHAMHPVRIKGADFAGLFFNDLPNSQHAVAIWRYKPWNSWSKPIALKSALEMPGWDVQFFYWKYDDGTYGAAVPLSGNGYRTTLGTEGSQWGSKAVSLDSKPVSGEIPAIAIAFGNNPYKLFSDIYAAALLAMDKSENLRVYKRFPEPFNYIGWCTWNSSDMGNMLNEQFVINGVKTFTDNHFPLGWILIDDGWFQSKDGRLQSQLPLKTKFPNGFANMNTTLKKDFHIRYTGIWYAFNGYWNGIDPESEIGKRYKTDLFSWIQPGTGADSVRNQKVYSFIRPDTEALSSFYDSWYSYFKREGFDFTKVDNQLVTERMAVNNYPIFTLSEKMHQELYKASAKYFNGALINCMDMTADAYLNFGTSAVARTVEDYFPYKQNETYNLQEGNAAAHVLQAVYNSIYFSQLVYPDFDMFQSNNPNAVFHAITRALTNGPIYLTDKPGQQNFDILNALVYHDGRIIHSETPLLPAADCLFQVQNAKPFKAFSTAGTTGLLGIFNAADADMISGQFRASDVDKLKGDNFLIYEHFSKKAYLAKKEDEFSVALPRMGYKLYYIVPVKNGFAPLGLTKKYNAPATIISHISTRRKSEVTLYEGGEFRSYCAKKPHSIFINGKVFNNFKFDMNLLTMEVPLEGDTHPVITFSW